MAALYSTSSPELAQKCAELRQSLKSWEGSFAACHNGRKPSREDVKQHREIAEKYKDYNKLRAALCHAQGCKPSSAPSPRKRSRTNDTKSLVLCETPRKRQKCPSSTHPSVIDPYDPPKSLVLTPSQQRNCIGPTPQKDGQVLGLFDGIGSALASKTPSKRNGLGNSMANTQATPSKRPVSLPWTTAKASENVPSSSLKPSVLDAKMTPSMERIIKSGTPGSGGKASMLKYDDTPPFLRRDNRRLFASQLSGRSQDGVFGLSPIAVRRLPQPAGRSLSAIVGELRAMEDKQLDEELEMLRELEDGPPPAKETRTRLKLQADHSQTSDMPLGPDAGPESDIDVEKHANEGKGRDGRPLKIWKKKGQKRTTRRVTMKPNVAKWKPEPEWKVGDFRRGNDNGTVAEPQARSPSARESANNARDFNEDLGSKGIDSEQGGARKRPREKPSIRRDNKQKDGLLRKAKKVSATAYANFRALKIKNRHSTAKRAGRYSGLRR
ncbi:MAG: hypothetical protein Q9163_002865 [Psora crenata]